MSEINKVALWIFGQSKKSKGFWYSYYIHLSDGLSEEQLFWVPDPKQLPIIWHIGHIAHRERFHIGKIIQRLEGNIIPSGYDIFGTDWCENYRNPHS